MEIHMVSGRCEGSGGKQRYLKKDAQRVANKISTIHNGRQIRIYQCNYCNFWHLTSRDE